jgi:peptidoglycan endopeptidase LytE
MSGIWKDVRRAGARVALPVVISATLAIGAFGFGFPGHAHEPSKVDKRRRHIEKRARKQLGAPYVYGGSSPSGFDCSGFTRWVFAGHGANLPHSAAGQFALGRVGAFKRLWRRARLHPGDLVFFKTTSARVGHAGIYVGRGRFIHASTSGGVRIDSVRDRYYWAPRWVGATRVPALQRR